MTAPGKIADKFAAVKTRPAVVGRGVVINLQQRFLHPKQAATIMCGGSPSTSSFERRIDRFELRRVYCPTRGVPGLR
jgi:hypothetical protein